MHELRWQFKSETTDLLDASTFVCDSASLKPYAGRNSSKDTMLRTRQATKMYGWLVNSETCFMLSCASLQMHST